MNLLTIKIEFSSALMLWQTEEEQEEAERKIIIKKKHDYRGVQTTWRIGARRREWNGVGVELYLPSRSRHITDQTKTIN